MSSLSDKPELPGLSSHTWFRLTIGLFVAIPVMVVVTVASTAISTAIDPGSETFKTTFFVICLGLFLMIGPGFFACAFVYRRKNRAENAAGYSTMPFEDEAVDVYDFRTGNLLRSAGEPPLTSGDQLRAARAKSVS
jgi:hypothetical protein